MPISFGALVVRSTDPARDSRFWAALLGREVVPDGDSLVLPGTTTQIALRFVTGAAPKTGQNPIHLHVVGDSPADQHGTAADARSLGAVDADVGQGPDADDIVLADPDGNEFCVLLTNGYLAGTGLLGEVACDGSHDVGLFWRDVLDWPLVWDRDGETAIQSPAGGTKLAWGGELDVVRIGTERYLFELVTDDLVDGTEQLLALGATLVSTSSGVGAVTLADPDGAHFQLRGR